MPEPTRPATISAGQHGAKLLDHRRAHEASDDRPRAELVERHAALQRQHPPVKIPVRRTTVHAERRAACWATSA